MSKPVAFYSKRTNITVTAKLQILDKRVFLQFEDLPDFTRKKNFLIRKFPNGGTVLLFQNGMFLLYYGFSNRISKYISI